MLRTAPRHIAQARSDVYEEYTSPAPMQQPRHRPTVPVRGPGHSLRAPRERVVPAHIIHAAEDLVNRAVQDAKMALFERKIEELLKEIRLNSPSLSEQMQREVQSWCNQFSNIEKHHVEKRAFAFGILVVEILDVPPCSQIEEMWLPKWKNGCEDILRLILNVDVEKFLEICAEGVLNEMEYDAVEEEAQVYMAAITQTAREAQSYSHVSHNVIKESFLSLQAKREEMERHADERLAYLNDRLNVAGESLLAQAERMEQLGEEEEKNAQLLEECVQLLQGLGDGR